MRAELKEKQKNRVCFTLIELVIVLVIIAILAALGLSFYRNAITKSKAGKAQNAISLIAEAEKIFRIDNDVYIAYGYNQTNATIGTAVTGMNLAAIDNDTDFRYRVTGGGALICGRPRRTIGTCPANNAGEIRLNLNTGIWTIPACYR